MISIRFLERDGKGVEAHAEAGQTVLDVARMAGATGFRPGVSRLGCQIEISESLRGAHFRVAPILTCDAGCPGVRAPVSKLQGGVSVIRRGLEPFAQGADQGDRLAGMGSALPTELPILKRVPMIGEQRSVAPSAARYSGLGISPGYGARSERFDRPVAFQSSSSRRNSPVASV
jgi:hypothetical protein